MSDLHVVVLAAGKGTRMKSELPKVLHRISGLPLLDYVLRAADGLNPSSISVVVGHQANLLQEQLRDRAGIRFARQEPAVGNRSRGPPVGARALWRVGDDAAAVGGCAAAVDRNAGGAAPGASGAVCSCHGAHGQSGPTLRLRSDCPLSRGNCQNRRGEGCHARRARHSGNQRGRVCLRARTAVPGPPINRGAECPGRVLPDRSRGDLSSAPPGRREPDGVRRNRDPRYQQPDGTR